MKKLYSICRASTKIWKEYPNGHHNDTCAEPGYFDAMADFINEKVMKRTLPAPTPIAEVLKTSLQIPVTRETTPETKKSTADPKKTTSGTKRSASDTKRSASDTKKNAPDTKRSTSDTKRPAPDTKRSASGTKKD